MNDYRDITIIKIAAGSYSKDGVWTEGTEATEAVCGSSDSEDVARNRNESGGNETYSKNFYLFTDEWESKWGIMDDGRRYTTQSFKVWPKYVAIVALAELP